VEALYCRTGRTCLGTGLSTGKLQHASHVQFKMERKLWQIQFMLVIDAVTQYKKMGNALNKRNVRAIAERK
jgi:hypothetical protein